MEDFTGKKKRFSKEVRWQTHLGEWFQAERTTIAKAVGLKFA